MKLDFTGVLKVANGDQAEEPEGEKGKKLDVEGRTKEVLKAITPILAHFDGLDNETIKAHGITMLANLRTITLTPYKSKTGVATLPQGSFSRELWKTTASMLGEAFDANIYKAVVQLLLDNKLLFMVQAGRMKQISFFASKEINRTTEITTAAKAYLLSLQAH